MHLIWLLIDPAKAGFSARPSNDPVVSPSHKRHARIQKALSREQGNNAGSKTQQAETGEDIDVQHSEVTQFGKTSGRYVNGDATMIAHYRIYSSHSSPVSQKTVCVTFIIIIILVINYFYYIYKI